MEPRCRQLSSACRYHSVIVEVFPMGTTFATVGRNRTPSKDAARQNTSVAIAEVVEKGTSYDDEEERRYIVGPVQLVVWRWRSTLCLRGLLNHIPSPTSSYQLPLGGPVMIYGFSLASRIRRCVQ